MKTRKEYVKMELGIVEKIKALKVAPKSCQS